MEGETKWTLSRGQQRSLLLAVLVLSFFCRTAQYLSNPSYWQDEASLVLNIRGKTAAQLVGPLQFDQAAPPLFLLAERGIYVMFGGSEPALRALPFVCGLIATVLFAIAARRLLPSPWDALAVLIFGTSDMLIWHAAEAKPYGTDVFVATLLLVIALPLYPRGKNDQSGAPPGCERYAWRFLALSVTTAIAVWFSYACIFVFAALSLAMLPALWSKRLPEKLVWITGNALVGVSFLRLFTTVVRAQRNPALDAYWKEAFIDWHHPALVPLWLHHQLESLCNYPLRLAGPVILIGILLGAFQLIRARRASILFMLAGPILFAIVAAGAHRYPFDGARLTTFLIPGVLLLATIGIEFFFRLIWPRNQPIAMIPGLFLAGLAMYWAVLHLIVPRTRAHLRPIAAYVRDHARPGDGIYVFQDREWNCYWPAGDPRVRYQVDRADKIPFRRFWVIWSFPNETGLKRVNRLRQWADQFATQLDSKIDKRGGAAFLYEERPGITPPPIEPPSIMTHHKAMHERAREFRDFPMDE